jgi:hypothetical protein
VGLYPSDLDRVRTGKNKKSGLVDLLIALQSKEVCHTTSLVPHNRVFSKPQSKALMAVSIFIRNDFETFKPTHDVLVEYPLTGDGLLYPLLFLCQLSFLGLFVG